MKSLQFLVILAIVFTMFSCSKKEVKTYEQSKVNGIKITENSTTPADSTFTVKLKEIASISNDSAEHQANCFRQPSSLDFDEAGNLYILDRSVFKVFKYDSKGQFIKTFGRQGQGPGEFVNPGTIIARKDTVYVTDSNGFKISKFNLDGEFISYIKYDGMDNFPFSPSKFGENYITYGSIKSIVSNEGKKLTVIETSLYGRNFNFIKNLQIIEFEPPADDVEFDPSEKGIRATASDINAYTYEHSKTQYKIDVYNINGVKVREIWKKYARVRTSEDEQNKSAEIWAKRGRKYKKDFNNSILNLYADKHNRLWVVCPSIKKEVEGYNYDVFENDIFINKVKLELDEGYSPKFVDDKIVGYNETNNSFKIYEY